MDTTRRVRINVTKGMRGEYSVDTTVEVTYPAGADYGEADAQAAMGMRALLVQADTDARAELARRKVIDAAGA